MDHPVSPYASTKKAAELVAHTFHHTHGLSVTSLRFFTAYGPRQRPDLAVRKFAERILRGEALPIFGDGSQVRDFTYIDDVVDGVVRSLDTELGYAVLNLGAGRTISVLEMIRVLEATLGAKADLRFEERILGDVSRTWADIDAARDALGYAPGTDFAEGVRPLRALARRVRGLPRRPGGHSLPLRLHPERVPFGAPSRALSRISSRERRDRKRAVHP